MLSFSRVALILGIIEAIIFRKECGNTKKNYVHFEKKKKVETDRGKSTVIIMV